MSSSLRPLGLQQARQASLSFTISWSLQKLMSHLVGDVVKPSHPMSSPSPPAFSLPHYRGLFQWVGTLHQEGKVLYPSHSRVLKLLGLCGYVCTHINMFVCIYQPLCFSHHTSVCRGEIAVHQGFAQFSIDPRLGNTPSPDFLAFPGPSLLPSLSCLDLLQISSFPLEPQVRVWFHGSLEAGNIASFPRL